MPAIEADILRALRSHLIAFAEPRGLPIAFTNKPFQAPPDGRYLRESFFPNGTVRAHISDLNSSSWRGLYQVDVFSPTGIGQTAAVKLASEIAAHFTPANRLHSSDAVVRITKHPEVASTMVEDAWIMIPTTVPWEVAG